MQFKSALFALAAVTGLAAAAAVAESNMVKRIADPQNPANLANCEPGGGADDCHLEQGVSSLSYFTLPFSNSYSSATHNASASTTAALRMATIFGEHA